MAPAIKSATWCRTFVLLSKQSVTGEKISGHVMTATIDGAVAYRAETPDEEEQRFNDDAW